MNKSVAATRRLENIHAWALLLAWGVGILPAIIGAIGFVVFLVILPPSERSGAMIKTAVLLGVIQACLLAILGCIHWSVSLLMKKLGTYSPEAIRLRQRICLFQILAPFGLVVGVTICLAKLLLPHL